MCTFYRNFIVAGQGEDVPCFWGGDLEDNMKRILVAITAAFVSLAAPSHALPVGWSFDASDSGGSISGSFIYDADLAIFSDFDIIVTPTAGSPVAVNNNYVALGPFELILWSTPSPTVGGTHLNFGMGTLTNAGGSVGLTTQAFICNDVDLSIIQGCRSATAITNGISTNLTSFTPPSAIPLPASAFLLIGGLAVLGMMRRRRRCQVV